ncbi:MAG: sugar transferase [Tenuifilaceae bacterium]|nr:sugar transferase [Tenuifilaceae bacterium]
MSKNFQVFKYLLFDIIGSFAAWLSFHYYRKQVIETQVFGHPIHFELDRNVVIGLIVLPLFWAFLFFVAGFYRDVFRRSRLQELGLSIGVTLIGVVFIFFLFLLDDYVASYRNYYQLFFNLLFLQFTFTYLPRLILTSITTIKIRKRKISFPTLIVGDGDMAYHVFEDFKNESKPQGNRIIGFVSLGKSVDDRLNQELPHLGDLNHLKQVVHTHGIEELVLALEPNESKQFARVINALLELNLIVKAIPSMYDYLTGRVKMSTIFGTPLIQVSFDLLPTWQQKIKLLIDITASVIALIILLPVIVIIAIGIKITSSGPVLYGQERVGQFGKPFRIYKFRSMYIDAEANGPALSNKNDSRITPLGRFLRKSRFDEIPNFWNVIKGEMSLVGPRPERQFYIDQIIRKAPHYVHLQKVKPGITSWGQVKYGYAENVEQMIERLKYDLLYLENMSLYVDFKIMIYTIITVFKGRGV